MSPSPSVSLSPTAQPEAAPHSAQVLRQFRVVFNAVRQHFQAMEKQVGIGGAQVWALHLVGEHPGIGVSRLAQSMDIHQSTASNLVRQLVQRQLLQTSPSARDRRSVELRLSTAGVELLGRVPGPFEGVLPAALKRLPEPVLQQLHHNLGRLIKELPADEKAQKTPLAQM